MKRISRLSLAVVAAFAVSVLAGSASFAADANNVTGTWKMTVQTPNGPGSPVFTLKQDGEKVTGTYKGQLGESPVTGTVKGKDIALNFEASNGGQALKIEYTGEVDGATMKGKVNLGALGEGTFTGQKEK